MLYHLLYPLKEIFFVFNLFRYITFRAPMAAVTAFLVSLIFGPAIIRMLARLKVTENVIEREESNKLYELHSSKKNTPTMGGLFILLAVLSSTLLWADLYNKYILLVVFVTSWLGITGLIDDYLKHIRKKSKGLTVIAKLSSQVILGLILGSLLFLSPDYNTSLGIPFFKEASLELGIFYILFVVLVITGASNAVNLTDGLDGLAIGIVLMVAFAYSILAYCSGNAKVSDYLLIPYIKGSGELTVFCASIIGAALGFLWFNCYPASVFMGDVGSLALGGALAAVAIFIKKELLLIIVGGIFVVEVLSVILQIGSFKLKKRRLFKIAPLHHHFQFLGWEEPKVIVRFWIIAALLALLTVVTLKIR